MIIKFFFDGIFLLVSSLFSLFPIVTLPEGVATAFSYVVNAISAIGFFVPLGALGICFVFCLAMYKLDFLIAVFHWFLRKIPGIS